MGFRVAIVGAGYTGTEVAAHGQLLTRKAAAQEAAARKDYCGHQSFVTICGVAESGGT
jgi:uncharacterized NAD(P)/FAD-binding protein YdhS